MTTPLQSRILQTIQTTANSDPSPIANLDQPIKDLPTLLEALQQHGHLPKNLTYQHLISQVSTNAITDQGDFSDYPEALVSVLLNTIKGLRLTLKASSNAYSKTPVPAQKKSSAPRKPTGYNLFRADPTIKQQVKDLKQQLSQDPQYADTPKKKLYYVALKQLWTVPGTKELWNDKARQLASE